MGNLVDRVPASRTCDVCKDIKPDVMNLNGAEARKLLLVPKLSKYLKYKVATGQSVCHDYICSDCVAMVLCAERYYRNNKPHDEPDSDLDGEAPGGGNAAGKRGA
ncbi:hypothetical protein KR018_010020 [Drosophila ironensis]|nr:hypothetical protein KR018_010020 [Drosophila ironensis]